MTIVVTRHPALIDLLIERGIVPPGTPVVAHATAEQLVGQDVIGVLPLHLAAVCRTVTEVPLALTPGLRGQELDLETLRQIAGAPVTYVVRTREQVRAISNEVGHAAYMDGCAANIDWASYILAPREAAPG